MSPALRGDVGRHRRRFLVAHELGHSLFFERSAGSRPRRRLPARGTEEEFCDEFARWLLVPPEAVRQRSARAREVFDLHRAYDVSVQVAARAFHQARRDRSWLAIAVRDAGDAGPSWRIQWASPSCPQGLLDPVAAGRDPRPPSLADWAFEPERGQLVMVG